MRLCITVSTEYRRVTDGQTDIFHIDRAMNCMEYIEEKQYKEKESVKKTLLYRRQLKKKKILVS